MKRGSGERRSAPRPASIDKPLADRLVDLLMALNPDAMTVVKRPDLQKTFSKVYLACSRYDDDKDGF
jgi:hypothetical protein